MTLTDVDIEYLIDECGHIERGAIAGGVLAINWLEQRRERENRQRHFADDRQQPQLDLPAFLRLFVNELAAAARSRLQRLGWDPWHPPPPPDGSVFYNSMSTTRQILLDIRALDLIERLIWDRSGAAESHRAQSDPLLRASVERHKQRYPDGDILPALRLPEARQRPQKATRPPSTREQRITLVYSVWETAKFPDWETKQAFKAACEVHKNHPLLKVASRAQFDCWSLVKLRRP